MVVLYNIVMNTKLWAVLDNANIENTALLGSNLAWASVTGIDPEKLKKATTAATLK